MCVWDTIHDNGWRLDSRTHRILDVIENILNKTEEFPLPNCKKEVDCADCGLWHYDDRRDGNHTITPTATSTQTATEPPDDPWAFIT
ncbi:uncharacterized protein BX664DRAFT_329889 [Halteromyces radiatus]|uniref:uncharacterized protein n=1 Tax=Halteromyces radiatus TaxID=101107 RepID=UPI00221F4CBC|nr:uncharacterized protein BX664DRAFT_329889 [Halteromyces radiatus]KAI8093513.1 hypothetical protein BX664DRAFT_329889 [Halteromyces radiatus]